LIPSQKMNTLWKLSKKEKFLLLEAYFYLGWSRILKSLPFRKLVPQLGTYMNESPYENDQSVKEHLRSVSSAIHIMSKYTFWESQCLVKAIAGMKMLERRGVVTTLYLGTSKDKNGKMIAHAWLRSGTYYICGYEEMKKFTVVSMFSNK
jgi:hypothetical protein